MSRKILIVIDSLGLGGAQVVCLEIMKRLDRRVFSFVVCSLRGHDRFSAEFAQLGTVIHLGAGKYDPTVAARLARVVKAERPDVVHTCLFKANLLGPWAARKAGCRCLLHDHSGVSDAMLRPYLPWGLAGAYRHCFRRALRAADCVVTVNRDDAAIYRGWLADRPERVRCVPNTIDSARFTAAAGQRPHWRRALGAEVGAREDELLIGVVARLSREKGIDVLVRALARCGARLPPYRLIVAGEGPERQRLAALAERLHLGDRVTFLGRREDVPQLLAALDMLVLPSPGEPFGLVLVEAMFAGTPVVAVDRKGPHDIVENGRTGLLLPDAAEAAMADALCRLAGDPELRRQLAQQAAQHAAANYEASRLAALWEPLYSSLSG